MSIRLVADLLNDSYLTVALESEMIKNQDKEDTIFPTILFPDGSDNGFHYATMSFNKLTENIEKAGYQWLVEAYDDRVETWCTRKNYKGYAKELFMKDRSVKYMLMNHFPKRDTLRSKRNLKRRVHRTIRILNKDLRKDVFGDRFWLEVRNANIVPYDDNSGWNAQFNIVFHDREHPERDYDYWFDSHNVIYSGMFCGGRYVDSDLNDFIVNSDFWEKYRTTQKIKVKN